MSEEVKEKSNSYYKRYRSDIYNVSQTSAIQRKVLEDALRLHEIGFKGVEVLCMDNKHIREWVISGSEKPY